MTNRISLPSDPRTSAVYTDWVHAHDPGAGPAALGLLTDAGEALYRAYGKPGRFLDSMEWRARQLPPAHLPWFWDTMGHRLFSVHLRSAARAFGLARKAERTHQLPVDADWHRANVLLYARHGALPATELGGHQAWLAAELEPGAAHEEFVRLLGAWGASPGELPADLGRRVRASARAAGLGPEEDARILAPLVAAAPGTAVPDRLLDAVADLMTGNPPGDEVRAALFELFPESRNNAASWLRILLNSGAADAAAAGRIEPEGGLADWLRKYARAYSHRPSGGGVVRQPMPAELFELVGRFAPRLRAAGTAVRLHEDRYRYQHLDADLLDACLAEGIEVHDPGDAVRLEFWDAHSQRDLKALAADPVFGRRLEGTVHSGLRGRGTAITRLPHNAGIAAEVHSRIESLLAALRGGGLAAADEAVDELRELLDRPTATALEGIEEALAELDLTGPLARALRAGLPEELGWPALEEALAGFGPEETVRVTTSWPVLTVYGAGRAVAVDHAGPRGSCTFEIPEQATFHAVHWAGGQFLVSWTDHERHTWGTHAFWADRPEDVFVPEQQLGLRPYGGSIQGGLGYQFETPDGTGRFDGDRILRPGDREGIGGRDFQLSDGSGFWSGSVHGTLKSWARLDPATGARTTDRTLPEFHRTAEPPAGTEYYEDGQVLAFLPPGAPVSPLGQDGRLVGCRIFNKTPWSGYSPREFRLESVDGRTARYRSRRWGRRPFGIIALPQGAEDAVLTGDITIRCHAAEDNSLLWQVHGFPGSEKEYGRTSTLGAQAGPVPPPAFWHFLTPRDDTSSKALRTVADQAVRSLLDAALHPEPGRDPALPGVAEPRVREGVARAARLAAGILHRRRELSRRVAIMRSGPVVRLDNPVPDTVLTPALRGLLPEYRHPQTHVPQPHPALLTAVAADGRHLRGEIDDETRRLALPAVPAEWAALAGRIDAVAWRVATAPTPEEERAALAALLETWSTQPFAEPGRAWRTGRAPERQLAACRAAGGTVAAAPEHGGLARFLQPAGDPAPAEAEECETVTIGRDDRHRLPRLLELLAEHGPLPLQPEAVDLFCWRTGVRRPVALLVLAGLPDRARQDDLAKLLRSAPYKANKDVARQYASLLHRLGPAGQRAVLAAGMPEDPAELWAPGGTLAAAERMAAVWGELLGTVPYVDEGLAAALDAELGLPDTWARSLPDGRSPEGDPGFGEGGFVLAGSTAGTLALHHAGPDGTAGAWVHSSCPAHTRAASVVAWALTERPVADPAARGALALYARLRSVLDDPGTLIPLGRFRELARQVPADPAFAPYQGPVLPGRQETGEGSAEQSTAHDDGLFVVSVPAGDVFLRPAALSAPARLDRAAGLCTGLALPALLADVHRHRDLFAGLARLTERATATPVPPGGYETNPALSVPALVTEVARTLGVSTDAAALHLQLLALARPTDANVRRWNAWSPARHKAAQAELVAAGAVRTGRRARAGRTAFLPGPWTEPKPPHLPLEAHKPATHLATVQNTTLTTPLLRLLSPVPLHELFAEAWTTWEGDRAVV
ncbi:hypothetical protein DEJ50_01385 [Streptomyces venezuelae]|uniref:DNA-binding protein n=1 Tax=Streptomyces venezuelae TaxID=54571 RepID=A0A5P2CV31_STRVZ|nr:hypothetical protein [Streptomyces venezuelae]QES46705.1 hypothetical protein DEJ50_01385 [Streptomyces venezuelae]